MAEKNVIYYYSGTGNTLSIARQIAKKLGNTDVISIYELRDDAKVPQKYARIGICTATCFSEPPRIVRDICEKMEILRSQKVFIVSTCGGSDGTTRLDLKIIMQPKTDYPVRTFMIRMPPNHIVGFDPFADDVANGLLEGGKEPAAKAAEDVMNDAPPEEIEEPDREAILNMSRTFNSGLGVDRDSHEGGFYVSDACTNCGICEKLCKYGTITLTDNGPVWGDDCQQCMACIQWCPQQAIRHPNVPEERKHYHNPDVTLDDMLASEFPAEEGSESFI